MKGRFAMNENMNKKEYIESIIALMEDTGDMALLDFIYRLLYKAA